MKPEEVLNITDKQILAVKAHWNKTDEEIAKYVQLLKDWVKKQNHLPQDEDDRLLILTLALNKFSLEKCKKKLDMFYTVRTALPNFYENRQPINENIRNLQDIIYYAPLPILTNKGERIVIYKLKTPDVSKFDLVNITKYGINTIELRYKYDMWSSDHHLLDVSNHTAGHLVKIPPSYIIQVFNTIQKAYSENIKGIHLINLPNAFSTLLALAKSISTKKLSERIYVHKTNESLHKVIPKEFLPLEYGGEQKSIEEIDNNWRTFMEENNDWLVEQQNRKSVEKLRVGEPISSEMFGSDGSFRVLKDID